MGLLRQPIQDFEPHHFKVMFVPIALSKHLNFFRIHFIFFTLTPLIFSGIYYAANGHAGGTATASGTTGYEKTEYIDALFQCYSAMTVTGLTTINISANHPFQQFILYLLFMLGDYSFVSLIMVLVRKRFFRQHCQQLLRNDLLKRKGDNANMPSTTNNIFKSFTMTTSGAIKRRPILKRGEKPVISEPMGGRNLHEYAEDDRRSLENIEEGRETAVATAENSERGSKVPSPEEHCPVFVESPEITPSNLPAESTHQRSILINNHENGQPYNHRQRLRSKSRALSMGNGSQHHEGLSLHTSPTMDITHRPYVPMRKATSLHTGFGGPPNPVDLIASIIPDRHKDSIRRRLSRAEGAFTLLSTGNYPSIPGPEDPSLQNHDEERGTTMDFVKVQVAKWLPERFTSGLVIGRNSRFFTEELDDEELEQLGGVEYRALRTLGFLVPAYIILFQIVSFAVLAIYFSKVHTWDSAFIASPGVQDGTVNRYWTMLFQMTSSYTGAGMSLIDTSMVPFAKTYLLVFIMNLLMMAGNHCLPGLVELIGYLVLNIGLPVIGNLSGWNEFSDALFQSISFKAVGFTVVSISALAPALQYEERALGVYETLSPEDESGQEPEYKGKRYEVFGKYLKWHLRRQLAFDIWPLALSVFLIAVIERGKLLDPNKSQWFTLFRIIFECTSAYSTVGLSLGTPNNNYSFSGELSTLSKLVMIAVMLRGRHRGLPVAIDRAIMLPQEYARLDRRDESHPNVTGQVSDAEKGLPGHDHVRWIEPGGPVSVSPAQTTDIRKTA
ncbi:Trk/Ktr/HKT type cation transporter, partial [Tremellales sp. Uapishka_1]